MQSVGCAQNVTVQVTAYTVLTDGTDPMHVLSSNGELEKTNSYLGSVH